MASYTNEGAPMHEHTMNHSLELFSKAGSLFTNQKTFYSNASSALDLFKNSWYSSPELSMRILFWIRDCRGGSGNRSGFRACLRWIAETDPNWIIENLGWVINTGRWDDLRSTFGTPIEGKIASYWASAILGGNILAAKWADRKDQPLRKALRLKEGKLRKLLAVIRKEHIVEHKMCSNKWSTIDYSSVPSVAMARLSNAFKKHDSERFNAYIAELSKPNSATKINASTLFPHDCVRTAKNGETAIADAQFEALPNYMEGTNEKVVVICDTSGSMIDKVSGSIARIDVAQALALYCSAKIPADNPFHKRFINFCDEGHFVTWENFKFSEAVCDKKAKIFNGAVGSTRIDTALDLIFNTAQFLKLAPTSLPTMLLIISDMQFTGTRAYHNEAGCDYNATIVEDCLVKWDKAGYARPKVVYWNLAGYAGSQATMHDRNVALISGFSPSIVKAVLGGESLSPLSIMMKAIEKYTISIPK